MKLNLINFPLAIAASTVAAGAIAGAMSFQASATAQSIAASPLTKTKVAGVKAQAAEMVKPGIKPQSDAAPKSDAGNSDMTGKSDAGNSDAGKSDMTGKSETGKPDTSVGGDAKLDGMPSTPIAPSALPSIAPSAMPSEVPAMPATPMPATEMPATEMPATKAPADSMPMPTQRPSAPELPTLKAVPVEPMQPKVSTTSTPMPVSGAAVTTLVLPKETITGIKSVDLPEPMPVQPAYFTLPIVVRVAKDVNLASSTPISDRYTAKASWDIKAWASAVSSCLQQKPKLMRVVGDEQVPFMLNGAEGTIMLNSSDRAVCPMSS